jgi:sugar lactone lactonase YvrE
MHRVLVIGASLLLIVLCSFCVNVKSDSSHVTFDDKMENGSHVLLVTYTDPKEQTEKVTIDLIDSAGIIVYTYSCTNDWNELRFCNSASFSYVIPPGHDMDYTTEVTYEINSHIRPEVVPTVQITSKNIIMLELPGRPMCATMDENGILYVCGFDTNRVLRFYLNKTSEKFEQMEGLSGEFSNPHSIAFDSLGNIYVCNYGSDTIQKYDKNGTLLLSFGSGVLAGPAGVTVGLGDKVLVADFDSGNVCKFTSEGGFDGCFGGFDRLHRAMYSQDGSVIYVADTWNHRIVKTDPNGMILGWIGAREDGTLSDGWTLEGTSSQSSSLGGFYAPVSVSVGAYGDLTVAEWGNNRIQQFTSDGKFIGWYGDEFQHPYSAEIHDDTLIVSDSGNHRVQIVPMES